MPNIRKYNHILLIMTRHLALKDCRLQRVVQNLMVSMNVSFVPAAQQAVLLFGGTQISSLAQLVFCRHLASLLTQEITLLKNDYLTYKTHLVFFDAMEFKIVFLYVLSA